MLKLTASIILAGALAVAISSAASAQGVFDQAEFSGTFEIEAATGMDTGNVRKTEFTLMPEFGIDLTPASQLTVIGRLRGDLYDELATDRVDIELREAYVDTEIGNTFLRIGKQQVVWGQADGLKVLDVLNPQSFREFILDDFEDSRIPLWTVNAEVPIGDAMLQLLWIPDKTYADIPDAGATFAFTSPLVIPEIPHGVPVIFAPLQQPDDFFVDSDVGAKLALFVGGWDLTINYAYHYFDLPITRREISSTGIEVQQNYERTHLVGGTISNVFGDFTLRGEVGFSSDRYFLTNELTDADGVVRSGELSYVLGVDYQGWRDWFVSAQLFQSIVTSPTAALVRDDTDTTMTLLIRRDFMNEALQVEALLIQNLNESDGVLQASVDYEWRSNIRVHIGADIFFGNSQGLFGEFRHTDRISIGIEFGF